MQAFRKKKSPLFHPRRTNSFDILYTPPIRPYSLQLVRQLGPCSCTPHTLSAVVWLREALCSFEPPLVQGPGIASDLCYPSHLRTYRAYPFIEYAHTLKQFSEYEVSFRLSERPELDSYLGNLSNINKVCTDLAASNSSASGS